MKTYDQLFEELDSYRTLGWSRFDFGNWRVGHFQPSDGFDIFAYFRNDKFGVTVQAKGTSLKEALANLLEKMKDFTNETQN